VEKKMTTEAEIRTQQLKDSLKKNEMAASEGWMVMAILALIETVREADQNAECRHNELLDFLAKLR